jgi:hypothetical protein
MKIEMLAKTGSTTDAMTLLKTVDASSTSSPDGWYLRGII